VNEDNIKLITTKCPFPDCDWTIKSVENLMDQVVVDITCYHYRTHYGYKNTDE
jgi:hypothetical protein